MISEYKNIPCCDLFEFVNKSIPKLTSYQKLPDVSIESVRTILLVDDTVATGVQMDNAKQMCKMSCAEIITFAPYVLPTSIDKVDIFLVSCTGHYFPWNIFKREELIGTACVDIDGVLCSNVPGEFDDDGEQYINFISNSKPLVKITYTIDKLVTGRLEKYRNITVDWLNRNNIKYKSLIMLPLENIGDRMNISVGHWKGEVYKSSNDGIFIESSLIEANGIFDVSRKPVYCTENGSFLQ
jgi:hypothetical protein